MKATKRNLSIRRVGKGRGVPLRLARGIARKYNLCRLVLWTFDRQKRQRIICWGSSDGPALIASGFAEHLAKNLNWSQEACDFELAFVRKLKLRIKELEAALAQIVEGDGDPVSLARAAGKFPDESDSPNLGAWLFFPQGKLNPNRRAENERTR
jgi:fermentation-respiration switch protein FrsA (DUF1100 family)